MPPLHLSSFYIDGVKDSASIHTIFEGCTRRLRSTIGGRDRKPTTRYDWHYFERKKEVTCRAVRREGPFLISWHTLKAQPAHQAL
jgi:hypothetical protein